DFLPFARNRNLLRGRLAFAAAAGGDERRERLQIRSTQDRRQRLTRDGAIEAEQPRRRAVDQRHAAVRIDRDHARGDAFQNRPEIAAASLYRQRPSLEADPPPLRLPAAAA